MPVWPLQGSSSPSPKSRLLIPHLASLLTSGWQTRGLTRHLNTSSFPGHTHSERGTGWERSLLSPTQAELTNTDRTKEHSWWKRATLPKGTWSPISTVITWAPKAQPLLYHLHSSLPNTQPPSPQSPAPSSLHHYYQLEVNLCPIQEPKPVSGTW